MSHDETEQEYYDMIVKFAEDIRMIPLLVKKEQPSYILNSLLILFLQARVTLWANDVANPKTIDKTWMLATGSPVRPFHILDIVGLTTTYNISSMNPRLQDPNTI